MDVVRWKLSNFETKKVVGARREGQNESAPA